LASVVTWHAYSNTCQTVTYRSSASDTASCLIECPIYYALPTPNPADLCLQALSPGARAPPTSCHMLPLLQPLEVYAAPSPWPHLGLRDGGQQGCDQLLPGTGCCNAGKDYQRPRQLLWRRRGLPGPAPGPLASALYSASLQTAAAPTLLSTR
jgi:hypothetical protein